MLRRRGRVCRLGTPLTTRSIGILALVISALVRPALSDDPPPLRSDFLTSISQGGAFIQRFAGDHVLLVRIPGRFFEPSDVCHTSSTCSVECNSLTGTANPASAIPEVVREVERVEQERLEAAAAASELRKPPAFKLRCISHPYQQRGFSELPGKTAARTNREREPKESRHLPEDTFFHSFPRSTSTAVLREEARRSNSLRAAPEFLSACDLRRIRTPTIRCAAGRWDAIEGKFLRIPPRLIQLAGYPTNTGELKGKLGPFKGAASALDRSYLHVLYTPTGEVAIALGVPQTINAAIKADENIGSPSVKSMTLSDFGRATVTFGDACDNQAIVQAIALFDQKFDATAIPLIAGFGERAWQTMVVSATCSTVFTARWRRAPTGRRTHVLAGVQP